MFISEKDYREEMEITSSCELAWEARRLSHAASILFGDADRGPTLYLGYEIVTELERLVLCELGRRYIDELNID